MPKILLVAAFAASCATATVAGMTARRLKDVERLARGTWQDLHRIKAVMSAGRHPASETERATT